ncbi:MAG: serine hydrolase [Dysgonamonadaceae bacterium]|jgi:beta-glucosidase-like glycosyl hydrolase/CubicO group peptidase (beta-lactamase class C family)|nr:serine hydrolase [Dysgonamonadaceae bacterium]
MKIWLLVLGLLLLVYSFVPAQNKPNLYRQVDQLKMKQWADSIFDSMSLDERIGQLFMLTAAPEASARPAVLKNIRELKIGGILFSKGTLQDQAESINLYQNTSRIPLLISFDGEWGLSMRLEDTPRFPKNMMLGAVSNNELIRLYGEEVGRELLELGVHINFAPVIDVNINPNNPVIGTRAFGEIQQSVAEKGVAYAKGLESKKIIAVAKHFPGHGDTSEDSHKTLPKINHSKTRLNKIELYPFIQFIREGFAGIMTAHLSIPALDKTSGLASSLSPSIVNNLLKNDLGFDGLAFTDALAMKGATSGKNTICVQALLAGNDILLNPNKLADEFLSVKKAIESGLLPLSLIEEKCLKVLQYKYIVGLNNYKPVETKNLSRKINSDYAAWLVRKLNDEAITLLKNKEKVIPIKQLNKNRIAILSIGADTGLEFQKRMALYGDFAVFTLSEADCKNNPIVLPAQLRNYNRIICGIHSEKIDDFEALQTLTKEKEVHLCFFTSPYRIGKYTRSIASSQSVVLAYENTDYAQKATAEVLMGGVPAKGKLPVTISDLFQYGDGLATEKVRLSYQEPLEAKMSSEVLKKIEPIVYEGIKNKAFPGCQVLVAKDGIVVYHKSFGHFDYAGTHAVRNTDVYDLASVTKAIATVPAIMKLYDTKKISLSNPISLFVPELKGTDKSHITIQNALFHESGLPAFIPFYQLLIDTNSYTGKLFSSHRDFTFRIQYDTDVYMRTDFDFYSDKVSQTSKPGIRKQVADSFYISDNFHKDVLKEIADAKLSKKKAYLYSDLNFMLLKEVTEHVSGQKFDNYLAQHFFAGLGANYIGFLPLKKINKLNIAPTENDEFWRTQILIGYPHDEAAAVMGGVSGNAGLFSNANDMAKIVQMLLYSGEYGGERYLSKATVKTFTETKSTISRRGLGFDKPDTVRPASSPTSASAPASTYGHTGYTGTCFWVDPDNGLIYIFLSNRVYPSRTHKNLMELNIRTRIQDVIYEAIKK